MRRAAKVDANHGEIVEAFKKLGCSVLSLAPMGKGVPDLLVGLWATSWLVEVKTTKGKLKPAQEAFLLEWRGPWAVVRNVEDVATVVASAKKVRVA